MSPQNNAKGAGITLLTAAAAAVTAGLCCVGPLLYLLFGISAASFAVFTRFEFLRTPLVLLSWDYYCVSSGGSIFPNGCGAPGG